MAEHTSKKDTNNSKRTIIIIIALIALISIAGIFIYLNIQNSKSTTTTKPTDVVENKVIVTAPIEKNTSFSTIKFNGGYITKVIIETTDKGNGLKSTRYFIMIDGNKTEIIGGSGIYLSRIQPTLVYTLYGDMTSNVYKNEEYFLVDRFEIYPQ